MRIKKMVNKQLARINGGSGRNPKLKFHQTGGWIMLMLVVFRLAGGNAAYADERASGVAGPSRMKRKLSPATPRSLLLAQVSGKADSEAPASPSWVTPKRFKTLAPHPRLFVTAQDIERMVDNGKGGEDKAAYETVEAAAETGLKDVENPMAGISRWKRGVLIQGRLTALAIQWHRTRDRRYLEAALKTIDAMRAWMLPHSITLAEGQFIAGVAVTYDLLYNDLTPAQRAWMVKIGHDSFATPFLRVTGPRDPEQRIDGERREWWMGIISNWNPVSISGGGLLALAMYEDLPEAQTMIDRVNDSYQPIFDYLNATEGGWVEGLGYWNWTIHYMSLFLISYERASGQKQAGFRSEGFHQTLTFGTYFVPHGEPCGFGDNQHGNFSSSLFAAAKHLGYDDALLRLQDHKERLEKAAEVKAALRKAAAGNKTDEAGKTAESPAAVDKPVNISYGVPQNLLIEPAPLEKHLQPRKNRVKHYPIQGWGMLADQWPNPTIYASVRGGELGGAHSYNDLLSWNGVVGIEKMITSISGGRSSSAAFGARDKDIYERGSTSKNSLFIGGLPPSRTKSGKV